MLNVFQVRGRNLDMLPSTEVSFHENETRPQKKKHKLREYNFLLFTFTLTSMFLLPRKVMKVKLSLGLTKYTPRKPIGEMEVSLHAS
jgi:hypothetical protein